MNDYAIADRIGVSTFKDDFMKRIISLVLVITTLLALASCSVNVDKEKLQLPPVTTLTEHSKEFCDESGKTVIKVSATIPQITDNCDEKIKNHINSVLLSYFDELCSFAQSNIENASNFMKSMNSNKPWSKKLVFSDAHLSYDYTCFFIEESLSYYDSEVEPTLNSVCFDMKTGAVCTLADFSTYPDDPSAGFEGFLYDIMVPALPSRFHNPSFLNEDVYSRIGEIVDEDNFYLTKDGMGFYFDKKDVHEYLDGTFRIKFTWNELSAYYQLPQ